MIKKLLLLLLLPILLHSQIMLMENQSAYTTALSGVIVQGNYPAPNATGSLTTRSWSVTVNTGSNLYMIYNHYAYNAFVVLDSVKFGTQKLTLIASNQGNRVQQWELLAPAVGTATLQWWCSTTHYQSGGATVFTGVNQSTPIGTVVSAAGADSVSQVSVTGSVDDMFFGIVGDVAGTLVMTPTAGQTKSWEVIGDVGGRDIYVKAATTSVTLKGTFIGNTSWYMQAVPIKPAP